MDNVGIVVENLKAAIAFFVELGPEIKGETTVEGQWVDPVQPMSRVSDLPIVNGHYWLRHSRGGAHAQFLKARRL